MEIAILILLILLNGIFAMSEIALVTARRGRLSARAAEGDRAAQAALRLSKDPTRFLSAIQIGITSIGLFSGIVGEAALAGPLAEWLCQVCGLSSATAGVVATVFVVAGVTYLSIVLGELVPKRLGQISPENTACLVARPMTLLALISRPFVALLTGSTGLILRMLGARADNAPAATEEEIRAMIDEGSEAGTIKKKQQEMLRNIFLLDDRQVYSIMVPRTDLCVLDTAVSPEENLAILRNSQHSWLPVCRGGLSGLFGVVPARNVLLLFASGIPDKAEFSRALEEMAQSPVFVPESLGSLELLKLFQEKGMHIAFIVDEYGTLQGIVTPRDLLDILAGQIASAQDEVWATQRDDGSWLMDGSIPVPELKDRLGLRRLPGEEEGHYSILSGLLMFLMGRIPREGEHCMCQGWRFEVVDMDGNRIDKVLAVRVAEEIITDESVF